jgi:hypothetical protein
VTALLVCLALTAAGRQARASEPAADDGGDRPYWRTNLFKRVATDQKFLLTRWWPQEMKKNPAFGASLAVGLALAIQSGTREGGGRDLSWETSIQGASGDRTNAVAHFMTHAGNGTTIAAILGITYLSSRRAHDDRLSEASSLAGESLLNAGLWIEILKVATARVRPNQQDAGSFFHYGSPQNGSFPSGHSMGAFSVASVFAESYRDKPWVPCLSYGLATMIGASRLALGRHFPGDVIVGAVLGTSIGRGVVARSREEGSRSPGVITPVVGPDGHGVGVGWSRSWN